MSHSSRPRHSTSPNPANTIIRTTARVSAIPTWITCATTRHHLTIHRRLHVKQKQLVGIGHVVESCPKMRMATPPMFLLYVGESLPGGDVGSPSGNTAIQEHFEEDAS